MNDMLPVPADLASLLIRTDYSDETAWNAAYASLTAIRNVGGEHVQAAFTLVNDSAFEGMSVEEIQRLAGKRDILEVFVADTTTMLSLEHPVTVLDVMNPEAESFRVAADWVWVVQNNLCIGNMGIEEFMAGLDPDGIYRGDGL